jgi:spore germination protein GerM
MIIVAAAAAYIVLRYGTVSRYPGRTGDTYRKPQSSTLLIYFADAQGEHLVAEERLIAAESSLEARIDRVVRELLKGPRGALMRTIPPTVTLESVRAEGGGVAWLNFSATFVSDHPGGSTAELMTIYSIVNTVTLNFSEVQKVGILVEGKQIDTLAGHIDCREPFAPDKTIIK